MEPKRHRIWVASSRLCSYQWRRTPLVPQQRPMDADRRRRRHRRRCLTSCCPPLGRPRRALRSVQQLAETAACCNDRRLTCSYSAWQQTSLVQQPRLLSRSTDRLAVSEAPFVGHVVDCRTLEMTQKGEKVRMRYLYVLQFPVRSCIFQPCKMVLHFPVLHFPKYCSCKFGSCFLRSSIFSTPWLIAGCSTM